MTSSFLLLHHAPGIGLPASPNSVVIARSPGVAVKFCNQKSKYCGSRPRAPCRLGASSAKCSWRAQSIRSFPMSHTRSLCSCPHHPEPSRCIVGCSGGRTERLARICTKASTKEREWQEYEKAIQSRDLTRVLEVLNVLNTFESDAVSPSVELASSDIANGQGDQKLSTATIAGPQAYDYLRILDTCQKTSDLMQVGRAYDWLKARGILPNFGKFKAFASEGERMVTEAVLIKSIGLRASKLSPKKWGLSGNSAIALPIAIGLFSYLLNNGVEVRPVAGLVLALGFYDAICLGGTGLGQILSMWLPHHKRVFVHEAGHFLVAYLLGCPIRGVVLNPIQAIKMGIQGQAGTLFWDETLEIELSQNHLTGASVDRYSIVLFAGIAAEALIFGEAQGGESDENLFKSVVSQLQPSWGPAKLQRKLAKDIICPLSMQISNQARWAVLQAFKLLEQNRKAHLALVEALEEEAGLGSLVRAIEVALVQVNIQSK